MTFTGTQQQARRLKEQMVRTRRTRSFLISEAIDAYLDQEDARRTELSGKIDDFLDSPDGNTT